MRLENSPFLSFISLHVLKKSGMLISSKKSPAGKRKGQEIKEEREL